MMKKIFRITFVTIIIGALSMTSFAQSKAKKKKKRKGPRKEVLSFEDELITGEAKKPDLFIIMNKKQNNFKKLIKLRDNFLPEMKRTTSDIQQTGGSN